MGARKLFLKTKVKHERGRKEKALEKRGGSQATEKSKRSPDYWEKNRGALMKHKKGEKKPGGGMEWGAARRVS